MTGSLRMRIGASRPALSAADAVRPLYRRFRPWAGLGGVDRLVLPYLPTGRGVFLEAGANDGIKQSNTLGLERGRGWSGVLIEPVPRLAERCRRNRPGSKVFNVALVDRESSGCEVELVDLDLMTAVVTGRDVVDVERQKAAARATGVTPTRVTVSGVTISQVLDDAGVSGIDFMSLDVEGLEQSVLDGLDCGRHAPRVMLVETADPSGIDSALSEWFEPGRRVSERDFLFIRRDWATELVSSRR